MGEGTKGGSTEHRPGLLDGLKARAEGADDGDDSGFSPWMILMFGAVLLIMINPGLRFTLGRYVGVVLEPLIGFGGEDPALTIFFASIITGVFTGVIRHVMVDWLEMAEVQSEMKAFQNELKEARKNDNSYRVKKLTELQPKVMKKQASMSGQQFKPMGFTMVVVIPMFGWLWTFLESLNAQVAGPLTINAPWGLGATELMSSAPIVSFLPTWILIYSLFSIPIGQLVQKGLKAVEFSRTLQDRPEAV
ncbi:hypothetical protein BRD56_06455 [Thermoplasmatales archaeon SW_10_69_26]|jgi:uncharacterized membrane protein (DUF106 family)|nr:MAG: hypothetical protein BRD56_06455 [Thermoplasmatales archaeon SW_10_69_26]